MTLNRGAGERGARGTVMLLLAGCAAVASNGMLGLLLERGQRLHRADEAEVCRRGREEKGRRQAMSGEAVLAAQTVTSRRSEGRHLTRSCS